MEIIGRGAEAVIYKKSGKVLKERESKGYRIKELDEKLRFERTKKESRMLEKARVSSPKVFSKGEDSIEMEFVEGDLLKEFFDEEPRIAEEVGKKVAELHEQNIIHSDLTTSNIIREENSEKLVFIDFGLSFRSRKIEDKAVDIHLFKQSLRSKHYKNFEEAIEYFINGYSEYSEAEKVLERLKKVESRGRNKKKG